jgi:6-pyruvoyl-tetrahydropterin synthase
MSTYTDLKNVVKETVTVNYDDRYTNQKVKFFNEENEFWGTYHGTLAKDFTLKGMGIDSAKIENSTLENVEISGCP